MAALVWLTSPLIRSRIGEREREREREREMSLSPAEGGVTGVTVLSPTDLY